jgi:DNA adenine methylase
VIRTLRQLDARHGRLGREAYYQVRDEVFNPRRRELMTKPSPPEAYPPDLAAVFVYLNRTGYNGLFRLNGRGEFNVPAGRYPKPRICDAATLRSVAEVLRQPEVRVEHDSFAGVGAHARHGDLVYLDPPYAPLSSTARFTSYTSSSFSDEDQARLQRLVIALAGRGCHVILSNSTAPLVTELYGRRDAREAGLRAYRVSARRAINSKAASRGEVDEYIISNCTPVP